MAIEHINEFDTLNAGREKINKHAIDPANRAELNAIDAKSVANQAKQTSQNAEAIAVNTDDRLDNIIAGEMQDAEVIDARRPFGSETYQTLGERLDSEKAEVSTQLAQVVIDVKDFGAKGDYNPTTGQGTDDTQAIQEAANYCRENNYKLFADNSKYLVTDTVNLFDIPKIDIRGTFYVSSQVRNKHIVKIGSSSRFPMEFADISVGVRSQSIHDRNNGNTGILIQNIYKSRVHISQSIYNDVGVELIGDDMGSDFDTGVSWNTIDYNSVLTNKTNFLLNPKGTKGFVNENTFTGSQNAGAEIAIHITGESDFHPNHNVFINPSIEECDIGLYVVKGNFNHIINGRFEGTEVTGKFDKEGIFNTIEIGNMDNINTIDDSKNKSNQVLRRMDIINKNSVKPQINFDDVSIVNDIIISPTHSMLHFSGGNYFDYREKASSVEGIDYNKKTKRLTLSHFVAIGGYLDTEKLKKATISIENSKNASLVFIPYNVNGEKLLSDTVDYVSVSIFTGTKLSFYSPTHYGGSYKSPVGDQSFDSILNLSFHDDVAYCWVGIAGVDTERKVTTRGFSIFSNYPNLTVNYYGNNVRNLYSPNKYSSSKPTSGEWSRGEKLYNYLPVQGGYLGWVCTESGNPGVWKGFGLIEQ